jgi:formylmethanofuran dehydrogenase subunit E
MCFDGDIQQATSCTFCKGNVANQPCSNLATTLPETMGFAPCAACHEPTARAFPRVVGDKQACIPCPDYDR